MLFTGIDIIEVKRVRQAIERWGVRFLRYVYTARELSDCGYRDDVSALLKYPSLAARWAAKEAAAKALGVGLRGLGAGRGEQETEASLVSKLEHHGLQAQGISAYSAGVHWTEIEVVRGVQGQPLLQWHGGAAHIVTGLGIYTIALSLSHTEEYAAAQVVALGQVSDE